MIFPDKTVRKRAFYLLTETKTGCGKGECAMPAVITDRDARTVSGSLEESLALFREIFSLDATFRQREVRSGAGVRCCLLYLDGMVSSELVNQSIVRPLILAAPAEGDVADWMEHQVLYANDVARKEKLSDLLRGILYGDSVLLMEGAACGLVINSKGWRTRGISEPGNETVQQGPREGFDEAAMLNLAQLRRKLLTPDLCIEMLRLGRRTDTMVFVCYLHSLAAPQLVRQVKERLAAVDIDGVLDSNYLNELIRDRRHSVFKTCGSTERPDVVAAKLLEGRVAVMVDGTPVVLTVPYLFSENFQSDEDYYLSFWVSSVGRALRYFCFLVTVALPAFYLALLTFHQRLLPTFLLLSAAQSRAGVPFSSLVECLLLLLLLEILKETGARMPPNLGHTLSIVGGLVVGQAAVEARLVSAPMLIAVAVSGIAGLMIPRLRGAVFYLRLGMVLLAAVLGLPGCFLGLTLIFARIVGLSSFGISCVGSLEEPTVQGLKDTVVRLPWWIMKTRPVFNRNRRRQGGRGKGR